MFCDFKNFSVHKNILHRKITSLPLKKKIMIYYINTQCMVKLRNKIFFHFSAFVRDIKLYKYKEIILSLSCSVCIPRMCFYLSRFKVGIVSKNFYIYIFIDCAFDLKINTNIYYFLWENWNLAIFTSLERDRHIKLN